MPKKALPIYEDNGSIMLDVDYGRGLEFEGDVAKDVAIDLNDLLKDAADNPRKIVFWGAMAAEAGFVTEKGKQELAMVRGMRGEAHRLALSAGDRKVTESMVTHAVEQDPIVIEAEAKLARLQCDEKKIKAAYEAARQRGQMIIAVNRIASVTGEEL